MSDLSGAEAVTDEEDPTEDMAPHDCSRVADAFDFPVPSTAASMAETIDSTEEVRNCEEWELFSDPGSDNDISDDSELTDDCDGDVEQPLRSCGNVANSEYLPQSAETDPAELTLAPENPVHDDLCSSSARFEAHFLTTGEDEATGEDEELSTTTSSSDRMCTDVNGVLVDTPVVLQKGSPRQQPNNNAEMSVGRRIQVVVRVRPTLDFGGKVVVTAGEKDSISLCVHSASTQGSITVTECTFDRVFLGPATQEDVFAAIEPSVQACVEGYNATVFAYGQTGTGKTHTLFGGDLNALNKCDASMKGDGGLLRRVKSSWGIVPRALSYLLDQAAVLQENGTQVDLQLSFLQIYNDRLFDLLTDRMRQKPLLIREHPTLDGTTSVTVQGLSSEVITSFSNAMQVIRQGHTNRCVRETEGNLASSRSHAIVQLHVTTHCSTPDGLGQLTRKARLNLVDLAGSEKWNTDVEMEDAHSQELKNINTSLSALGNCIAALTEIGRKHIPYRDSTLTRVLQDSFGGNTQSCLIATVNATQQFADETIRTLQFADRAKSVMQSIRVNEMTDGPTELLTAKMQIAKLRERLESEQRRRHETRLKEHQTLQQDFLEKLKAKDKEIAKLSRDNAVFQRWREEDVKKIRVLESRIKDLELQIGSNYGKQAANLSINAVTQILKHEKAIPAVTRQVTREQPGSRQKLTRVDSRSGNAAQTYKQVLERYALGTNSEQPKTVLPNMSAHDLALPNSLSNKAATNQYEKLPPKLSTSAQDNQRNLWVTGPSKDRIAREPEQDGISVQLGATSSLCVSPVTYPPSSLYKTTPQLPADSKGSWAHANLAPAKSNYSNECASSLLPKSTPAVVTHKQTVQQSEAKHGELWSPPAANIYSAVLKQEPSAMLKRGAASYSSLPQSSVTLSSTCSKGSTCTSTPCQRHKIAGCMLCAVTESSSRQNQGSPVYQSFAKETVTTTKAIDATRKPQDGPCERHQLIRCFICTKGSANSTSTSDLPVGVAIASPSSAASYSYGNAASANGHTTQSLPVIADPNSKCAIHALANCILCAGVKAMTRKMASQPHASPAKTSVGFGASTRNLNISEDHIADRQRRYTLDERILSYP